MMTKPILTPVAALVAPTTVPAAAQRDRHRYHHGDRRPHRPMRRTTGTTPAAARVP